jgi:hypothetical protein
VITQSNQSHTLGAVVRTTLPESQVTACEKRRRRHPGTNGTSSGNRSPLNANPGIHHR